MSLLGIDVGTTGCKAIAFREEDGALLGAAYREYDVRRSRAGQAELDVADVWERVKDAVREAVARTQADPVRALAVSSMGEAMVPVTEDRRILGPSILMDDMRGSEYLERLSRALDPERLFAVNGNTLGNHYSLTKILWWREHEPRRYEETYKLLLWSSFVAFMLGADAVVDYSLANRTLLFDVRREAWSQELLNAVGLDDAKLPATAPSGTAVGTVSPKVAEELGLPAAAVIVTGAHDQCANALGCGVTEEGRAMLGMGTYICLVPTYRTPPSPSVMMPRGLNVEHHAVPGLYASFIYNQGGSLLKWYRDTFARADHDTAKREGRDTYDRLLSEMPEDPSNVVVLPHFAPTGPPEFITDSCGVMAGLRLGTTRGEVVKGILEGVVFYLRDCVENLPETGIAIDSYRAVGGGSRSDAWVQLCADILQRPFTRPEQTEAGALGAAIMAGAGAGTYASMSEGADRLVRLQRTFEPDPRRQTLYDHRFDRYRHLYPALKDYLRTLSPEPA